MAGYTTAAFRRVLADHGAPVLWTEMVSAAAMFYGNKKTLTLLEIDVGRDAPHTPPTVVQLFGKDPKHFDHAIKSGHLNDFAEININMGCPANKIIKNGEGVGLMKNPDRAREIIVACINASNELQKPLPVSVKMRLGDKAGFNYVEFARMCESAGATRLIVHGRYAEQGYSGTADWNAIAEIVRAVKIPVIANGDIRTADDAKRCIDQTKAAGVMVGRALLPLYRKYFPQNLRILRGEKICKSGGIDPIADNITRLFGVCDAAH